MLQAQAWPKTQKDMPNFQYQKLKVCPFSIKNCPKLQGKPNIDIFSGTNHEGSVWPMLAEADVGHVIGCACVIFCYGRTLGFMERRRVKTGVSVDRCPKLSRRIVAACFMIFVFMFSVFIFSTCCLSKCCGTNLAVPCPYFGPCWTHVGRIAALHGPLETTFGITILDRLEQICFLFVGTTLALFSAMAIFGLCWLCWPFIGSILGYGQDGTYIFSNLLDSKTRTIHFFAIF